jgi:prepilin signal peptidase PulO-like enzyme (type II secretory pathway)
MQNEDVLPSPLIAAFAFVFGLVIGSFLNVCILRIPGGKSIVLPASACPKCGKEIKAYDNIPVVSWLLLRGKCRGCKAPISPMYPIVEFLTGILFLGSYLVFGLTFETIKWCAFSAILVVLVFTDYRERILPDAVNYTGLAIGLLLSLFTKPADGTSMWIANKLFDFPPPVPVLSLIDAVIGALAGVGSILPATRPRRHGPGRRENDADGGHVSRSEADAADDSGGIIARQRAGNRDYRRKAKRFGLRAAVRNVSGRRRVASGFLWNSGRKLVSGTADGTMRKRRS